MNSNNSLFLISVFILFIFSFNLHAQVKVAADADLGSPAHPSSIMEVFSTNRGFLPPRLSKIQRDAIPAAAEGLTVYNTTENCINVYDGAAWNTYCDLRFSTTCNCIEYLKDYDLVTEAWIPIASPPGFDHDWYEEATTTAPDAITDNIFTQGRVGIGIAAPAEDLHIAGNVRSDSRSYFFGPTKRLWADASSAFYLDGVHPTITQLLLRDGGGNVIGKLFGTGSGANFGLADRNSQWVYLSQEGVSQRFLISNDEKMRITAAGNVGIGVTAPTETLDLVGGARVRVLPAGAATDEVVVADATGVLRKLPAAGLGLADHDWYTVGTTTPPGAITDNIFTQGNTGIGIANPLQQLHVAGAIRTDARRVYFGAAQNLLGNNIADLTYTSNSPSVTKLRFNDSDNVFYGAVVGTSDGTNFGLNDKDSHWTFRSVHDQYLTMSVDNSEKVRIWASGTVGIGTTTPTDLLDVNGTTRIRTLAAGAATDQVVVASATGVLRKLPASSLGLSDHDWYEVGGTTPPNSINDNQYTQGNVAIGLTNPVYTLDVNGEITSRAANAFRMRYTAYSLFHRIDANRYYQLITNLNDQDGSWNTLRPYFVELATGNVSIVNNGIFARHSDRFIGLNVNTPTQRLDVNGGARVRTLPVGLTSDQVVLADATGVLRKLPISTIVQTGKDHDWYEVGTTEPPNSINDSQFTQGRVGIGHANPAAGLHVNHSDGVVAQGILGVGAVPLPGAGIKMVWSPRNAAFRAGRTNGTQWDEASMGNYSTGFGYNSTASGSYTFASGVNSQASGVTSIAMGNGANASNTNAIALGFQTVASGNASIAIGFQASATGTGSKSFGGQTVASGTNAIALGEFTYARSRGEVTVGLFSTDYAPIGGAGTFNIGDRAFCVGIGSSTTARANALRIYKNGKSRFDGNVDIVTSTTSADEGLYVTNNGTAISTVVSSSNVASTSIGLYVRHTGLGEGARIRILNAASTAPVLTAYQGGLGEAGYFRTLNATSTDPVVTSYNGGLGRGIYSTIQNTANTEPAVAAYTSGTGEAIYAGGTTTTGAIIGTNFKDLGGVWRNTSYLAGAPGVQGTTENGQAGVAGSVWKPTLAALNNTSGGYFSNIYGPPGGAIFAINYTRVSYVTAGGAIRKIDGPGASGTIVSDLDDKPVLMTSMESPEILFTDYGDGQLVNGKAIIKLDPIFSKNIIVNENNKMKVFVQLEGDCNGVYVTNKTANGFEVHELKGGTSNVTFSYEVVGNRANTTRYGNKIIFDSSRRFDPGPEEALIEGSGRSPDDDDRLDLEENYFAPDVRADKED